MILRKDGEFSAVTSAGETIHINRFRRIRHEYNLKIGFYLVYDTLRLLMDESGRRVNCIGKGNYQIVDGANLIDVVSTDPLALKTK